MNLGSILGLVGIVKKIYDEGKGRDQANKKMIYDTGPKHNTRHFIRDGVDFDEGNH